MSYRIALANLRYPSTPDESVTAREASHGNLPAAPFRLEGFLSLPALL